MIIYFNARTSIDPKETIYLIGASDSNYNIKGILIHEENAPTFTIKFLMKFEEH